MDLTACCRSVDDTTCQDQNLTGVSCIENQLFQDKSSELIEHIEISIFVYIIAWK